MKNLKRFIVGIIVVTMMLNIVTVFAGSETIEAFFNDIKITINGDAIDLKDAGGNPVKPFIYNGSTYLPVRAIAEALNMEVKYNETTNTVELAKKVGDDKMGDNELVLDEQDIMPQPSYKYIKEGNLEIHEHKSGIKYVSLQDIKRELYFDGIDKNRGTSFIVDRELKAVTFYYKNVATVSDYPLDYVSGTLYLITLEDYQNILKPQLIEAIK